MFSAGAILAAGPGETFSGFTVSGGKKVEVLSGGHDSGGTINSGGTLTVCLEASTAPRDHKGGTEIVGSGGIAGGVTVVRRHLIVLSDGSVVIDVASSGIMLASGGKPRSSGRRHDFRRLAGNLRRRAGRCLQCRQCI